MLIMEHDKPFLYDFNRQGAYQPAMIAKRKGHGNEVEKMAPIVLAAVLLISAFVFSARALPEDESGTSAVETQPPVSSQEPETQPPPEPTAPPYSEPEPQPEPSSSQEPEYTDPPAASSQTQAPDSSEEETQGQKSWLDIFKLPTEPTNEDASIPEKRIRRPPPHSML